MKRLPAKWRRRSRKHRLLQLALKRHPKIALKLTVDFKEFVRSMDHAAAAMAELGRRLR